MVRWCFVFLLGMPGRGITPADMALREVQEIGVGELAKLLVSKYYYSSFKKN